MGTKKYFSESLFDFFCLASLAGIWPRFVEPKLLFSTELKLCVSNLPKEFEGFKVALISDLHLNRSVSPSFLDKIVRRTARFKPDLVLFAGDFLCFSKCDDMPRLKKFLTRFQAPNGCFAVLGNHDYSFALTVDEEGRYAPLIKAESSVKKAINRLLSSKSLTGDYAPGIEGISPEQSLVQLLEKTPFKLLHNETVQIEKQKAKLNLTGLGEVAANQCRPEIAFQGYDKKFPGLILAHNPDTISRIKNFPGDVVLSGHTHGGQINLPGIWQKLTLLENPELKSGLFEINGKTLYISRGVGSVAPFRLFTPPELTFIILQKMP